MSTDKKGHFSGAPLDTLHDPIPHDTENGACLTGHEPNYYKENSCSYRYQALEHAKGSAGIKARLHSYRVGDRPIRTSAYPTNAGGLFPNNYSSYIRAPRQPGDWHVTGPNRPIVRHTHTGRVVTIPPKQNFKRGTWPYWNNAHHLIPKGTFSDMIIATGSLVSAVIQQALLKAKYNINHRLNMVPLPQDKLVAKELGLARHILLVEDDSALGEQYMNHPTYNEFVEGRLNPIITEYEGIAQGANPQTGHPIPDVTLDKKKLENLSTTMLKRVLSWGQGEAGPSICQKAGEEMGVI